MDYLFLFHNDQSSFQPNEVRSALENIPDAFELTEDGLIDSRLRCEFGRKGDQTTLRLSENLQRLSIHGTGRVSQQAALEFQRRYPKPLQVTDLDYGFDLPLTEIGSVEEFTQKIQAAYSTPEAQ